MNPSFSSTNQPKPYTATKLGATKAKRKDRHMKVNGRESRVRISKASAPRVFQLSEVLGHRTTAQTIEWLLEQAEPAVNKVLGTTTPTVHANVAIPNSTAITPRSAAISPPQLPPLPALLTSSVSLEAEGLQPVVERDGSATADGDFMFNLSSNGNGEPELSIDDYPISIPVFPYI